MQLSRVLKCNSILLSENFTWRIAFLKATFFLPFAFTWKYYDSYRDFIYIETYTLKWILKLSVTPSWSKVLHELCLLTVLTQMRGRVWRVEMTGVMMMTVLRSARTGSRGQSGAQEGGDYPCLQHWWPSQTTQARCHNHRHNALWESRPLHL